MEEKRARQLLWRHNGQQWWCRALWVDIQSLLESISEKYQMGLYRDDGLIILGNTNSQQKDKIRKNIISIDFKIEITTNLTEVDFFECNF